MKTIYKYQLTTGLNELEMPYTKILNVINQGKTPTLYALVDAKEQNKSIKIYVFGTGWDIEDNIVENSEYLNTITDGMFVWHIFIQK